MGRKIPQASPPTLRSEVKRVLLDTNIWRYVLDGGAQSRLRLLASQGPYRIQIAPGVLYETLRLENAPLRDALVRLMTHSCFERLMPEAYSESMEILREVERVRPEWLRRSPDLTFFNRLKKDWSRKTAGFWVRCARSTWKEAEFLERSEGQMIAGAQAQTKNARQEMIDNGWKRNPSMDKTLAGFSTPMRGWRGDLVEMWRIDSWAGLTLGLGWQGNAYRDWIAPFVDVDDGLLQSVEWLEFWLYDADNAAMPRQWMRWAHSFAQRFRKPTPGSPGDTQLSTYFMETDIVVSADKALIDILTECRPFAPCSLPEGILVPAGPAGVGVLFERLQA